MRALHPMKGEKNFQWRGPALSRLEALSDLVFAFALTLLVVSAAPPANFVELIDQLWSFPGFAAAFSLLLAIWHAHYIFFRRYGLEDAWTITLNAALLFLILFYVYPLKFLATMFSDFVRSVAANTPTPPLTPADAGDALAIFSIAYAAMFLVFALLYRHALKRADALDLTAEERRITRQSVSEQLVHVGVGSAVAIGASTAPVLAAPFLGFLYFLIWPLTALAARLHRPQPGVARDAAPNLQGQLE